MPQSQPPGRRFPRSDADPLGSLIGSLGDSLIVTKHQAIQFLGKMDFVLD